MPGASPSYYEFFAGGGMVRAGLGEGWTCLFANDFDPRKGRAYAENWGGSELRLADIRTLAAADLPGQADLAWGSFPCQDLSLAGAGAGLKGARSGTFYPFWDLVSALNAAGRGPNLVVVENVCGALTSRGGCDFEAICSAFVQADYRFGPLVIDAELFVPQSRPRLFVIGVHDRMAIDPALVSAGATEPFQPASLIRATHALPQKLRAYALWWRLSPPARRNTAFEDLIETEPEGVRWHTPAETAHLLELMAPANLAKLEAARRDGHRRVGAVYRRTRMGPNGDRLQRAEVRFDSVAGCLRTPAGGSSRQAILEVEGDRVRSRLISARETARLMGLADSYRLPEGYNEAYHLTGDGVVVDVVRFLARALLEPLLRSGPAADRAAA